ncbi:MAG: helix-turn-helix domain-containing protein, partial [Nanoarchaeota archaeon]
MNKQDLKELGLTEHEIDIYLALLQHGSLSAYDLAEKLGFYRQLTYDLLHRLMEKGYVHSVQQGKTRLYSAANPQFILEHLRERVDHYQHLLPELLRLQTQSHDTLSVETYKGKNVLRIAFRDIITTLKEKGGEVLCTAVDETLALIDYKTLCDQYERDLLAYHIKERVFIKEGMKGIFTKGTSAYRTVPARFFNKNPT